MYYIIKITNIISTLETEANDSSRELSTFADGWKIANGIRRILSMAPDFSHTTIPTISIDRQHQGQQ